MRTRKMESLVRRFFRKRFPKSIVRVCPLAKDSWVVEAIDEVNWLNFSIYNYPSKRDALQVSILRIFWQFLNLEEGTPEELELLLDSEGA